jgi:predicted SAM-dependent methyltransferase
MKFTKYGNLKDLSFPQRMMQKCPLCGEMKPINITGMAKLLEDDSKYSFVADKGYSFCNCRNVYFTDWSNIDQAIYDDRYVERYASGVAIENTKEVGKEYLQDITEIVDGGKLLDVGSINDAILDVFCDHFETYSLDIIGRESKHKQIIGNFEEIEIDGKFSVIWASHIFEHFRDPISAIKKCYDLLEPNGMLFIAMPDPYFINYADVYSWGHWNIREHHIFWDLYSFIKECEMVGFEKWLSVRNVESKYICNGDFHILLRKP